MENFAVLSVMILNADISTAKILAKFVEMIVEKATKQPSLVCVYVKLCDLLSLELPKHQE